MNVRAIAGLEQSASAEKVDQQIAAATGGTTSTIPAISAGDSSRSDDTDFEVKMRAQLALITAPSESDRSNTADSKIEEKEDLQSADSGKLAGKKLAALLQRFSDRPNQFSASTSAAARHFRLQASHGKDSSAAAPADRAGSLTAESVATIAPWIGCESPMPAGHNAPEDAALATSFDVTQSVSSVQSGAPTQAMTSGSGFPNTLTLDSNDAALKSHSQPSSPIDGGSGMQSAQKSVAGEQAKGTGISTQANFARPVLTTEMEQPANGDSSLLPLHSNASLLIRTHIANVSEVGRAVDPDTKALTYGASTLVRPSDTNTRPVSSGNQIDDSVSAPLSPGSDQRVQLTNPTALETKRGSKSFRQPSADEFIGTSNREHLNSAHSSPQENGNAPLAPEISPTAEVQPRSSHEQRGQFHINEAFTALDSGTAFAPGFRTAQHGGRAQAEAGFQDPSLGWIGVRAENHAGALHATVLSSSTEAAQALSGHIAGLHSYLADRNTSVESVTFVSMGGSGEQAATRDSRDGAHQGSGDQTDHDSTVQPSQQISQRLKSGSHALTGAGSPGIAPFRSSGDSIGARISVLA